MKKCFTVLVCVVVAGMASAGSVDECSRSPTSNCPSYNLKSDLVTPQQMQDQNVMGERWIMLYYAQIDDQQTYGKCNFRWHQPDENNIVRRELMCYNFDTKICEDYGNRVTRKEDSCGRVEENAGATMDAKFYSQDLSQYLWYDSCYNYTVSGDCSTSYLDLFVRDSRYPDKTDDQPNQELDLQGLPWGQISADLINNFNMNISGTQMKFSWKGPECGFDGKLKTTTTTSSASNTGTSYIALVLIVAFSFIY